MNPSDKELIRPFRLDLMKAINAYIDRQVLSQDAIIQLTGLHQSNVSLLRNVKVVSFSLEKLVCIAERLGIDVSITLTRK